MRRFLAAATALATIAVARIATGVRGNWLGCTPSLARRVYFANHASNGDFVLIWAVLPAALRARTRPVAAADYWDREPLRRFFGRDVFDAVLIERDPARRTIDPVGQMSEAIEAGASLILFPEGTRNTTDAPLLPFKTGLFHLAVAQPGVEMVPVWLENLSRVLPKGEYLPVPLLCTVTFGTPLTLLPGEEKAAFLARARDALLALRPREPSPP